ncbi:MAG: biotin--[Erysipelotrichaceae bacterium]|nr:biotin--[acetyl-CoA-carboxylase] ligase [Erysipelotrichaceae bacterium]
MPFFHFETIDSTNSWLKENWQRLEDMTFVSADYQSAGRGRRGRRWISPKGESLMFSLLVRDEELLSRHQLISLLAAYSVVQLLNGIGLDEVMIKWPNDVYAGDRKICGILLEGVSRPNLQCLIIGIGLNVNQKRFEGDYRHDPVSVYQLTGRESDIAGLRSLAYGILTENLRLLREGHDFLVELKAHDYLQGKSVRALVNGAEKTVEAVSLNPDGSLRVRVDDRETDITSGEISFHF